MDTLAKRIAPRHRVGTYLTVTNLTPDRPASNFSTIRGTIIGGTATWTGTKWDVRLVLGRSADSPADAGWWSLERVSQSTNPAIAGATSGTGGPNMSIGDFKRIGP